MYHKRRGLPWCWLVTVAADCKILQLAMSIIGSYCADTDNIKDERNPGVLFLRNIREPFLHAIWLNYSCLQYGSLLFRKTTFVRNMGNFLRYFH